MLFAAAAGTTASLAIAGAGRRELLHWAALGERLRAPAPSAPVDHCSCLLVHLLCLAVPVPVSPTPPVHPMPSPMHVRKSLGPYGSVSPC